MGGDPNHLRYLGWSSKWLTCFMRIFTFILRLWPVKGAWKIEHGNVLHLIVRFLNFHFWQISPKNWTGKCEPPPGSCSFAPYLVGKMGIFCSFAHHDTHQPVKCDKIKGFFLRKWGKCMGSKKLVPKYIHLFQSVFQAESFWIFIASRGVLLPLDFRYVAVGCFFLWSLRGDSRIAFYHGWSTNPPYVPPPRNKALIRPRETNGFSEALIIRPAISGGGYVRGGLVD